MDSARFQRLMSIFQQACEVPHAQRAEFVAARCASDARLRDEVLAMLSHDAQPAAALGADVAGGGARLLARELARTDSIPRSTTHALLDAEHPATIGPYRIIRKIGEGGMGTVFEAQQASPRRTVAVKVIRAGLTTPQIERRFEHEAQVLGRLQHPGIAQIFEAGTVDTPLGRRMFLAMEFVPGRHLTDHAAAEQLDNRRRMELLALVCDAVQHAHQRGVIHRDLKPANIVVVDPNYAGDAAADRGDDSADSRNPRREEVTRTIGNSVGVPAVAIPKILDFGVARVIDADLKLSTMSTEMGQIVGTLPYMSPEQVSGNPNDIDTRSDVYALGVILYKLLTGRLPYELPPHSPAEAARVIRDEAPLRLSTINRMFRGDVETIVERALDKNKARRYQSAADLAADIRSYLAGEPIEARRDSAMYVLRKQLRRYRGAVAAGLLFVAGLIAFGAYAMIEGAAKARLAIDEIAARQRAESERTAADRARELARQSEAHALAELRVSNVERGRLLGRAGNMRLAEDLLWPEHLRSPDSPYTRWALWELYSNKPCLGAVAPPGIDSARLIAVSADGQVLVTAGRPDDVHFWNLDTGAHLAMLSVGGLAACSIALHPQRAILAMGGHDGGIYLWDLSTGALIRSHAGKRESAFGLCFTRDGQLLVSIAADTGVTLRNPLNGDEVGRIPMSGAPYQLALDDRGRRAAVSTAMGDVFILDLVKREQIERFHAHTRYAQGLVFSPDGTKLVSAGDKICKIWDVRNSINGADPSAPPAPFDPDSRCIGVMAGSNETLRDIVFSPDGHMVATGGWWQIDLWEADGGRHITTLSGHREQITSLRFVERGNRLVSGSSDGTARVWELSHGASRMYLSGHTGQVSRVCFSRSMDLLASCGNDGTIRLWRTLTGESLGILGHVHGVVHAVQFMPDGQTVVSTGEDGTIRLWDVGTRTCVKVIFAHVRDVYDGVLMPDGKSLLTGGSDGYVRVWSLPDGDLRESCSLPRRTIGTVAVSDDGRFLLAAPFVKGAVVIDRQHSNVEITMPSEDNTWVAAISPDGRRVVSGLWSGAVDIWDVPARKLIARHDAFDRLTTAVAISPDLQLAAAATVDGTIKIMDLNSDAPCLATLTGHTGLVSGLSFSRDGRLLASASLDGRVGLWDLHYYDRHIARNLEDGLRLHGKTVGINAGRDAALRAWAAEALQREWPLLRPASVRVGTDDARPPHLDVAALRAWDHSQKPPRPSKRMANGK